MVVRRCCENIWGRILYLQCHRCCRGKTKINRWITKRDWSKTYGKTVFSLYLPWFARSCPWPLGRGPCNLQRVGPPSITGFAVKHVGPCGLLIIIIVTITTTADGETGRGPRNYYRIPEHVKRTVTRSPGKCTIHEQPRHGVLSRGKWTRTKRRLFRRQTAADRPKIWRGHRTVF